MTADEIAYEAHIAELAKTANKMFDDAQRNLNKAYERYLKSTDPLEIEENRLLMVFVIFNYDIGSEFKLTFSLNIDSFDAKVACRRVVLNALEYIETLDYRLLPDFKKFMAKFGAQFPNVRIKGLRQKYKSQFNKIRGWQTIRNDASGHYTPGVKMIPAIESINIDEVMECLGALLKFNTEVVNLCRKALDESHEKFFIDLLKARTDILNKIKKCPKWF